MFGRKKKTDEPEQKDMAIVTLAQVVGDEFADSVTPKKITDPSELFMFVCPYCGGVHFRHAGCIETILPYVRADKVKKVQKESYKVHVCVKCRHSFLWYSEQMYEITDLIDLEAWEEFEVEAQRCTGPGGQC